MSPDPKYLGLDAGAATSISALAQNLSVNNCKMRIIVAPSYGCCWYGLSSIHSRCSINSSHHHHHRLSTWSVFPPASLYYRIYWKWWDFLGRGEERKSVSLNTLVSFGTLLRKAKIWVCPLVFLYWLSSGPAPKKPAPGLKRWIRFG